MCACVLYFTHISVALFDHFDAMPWPHSVSHDRAWPMKPVTQGRIMDTAEALRRERVMVIFAFYSHGLTGLGMICIMCDLKNP